MEKEHPETYDSFFDRPEFEAFMFWHQFAGYIRHIQELADYLLQNKHKQQLVVDCLGMINVEIDAIKTLLYETYGLVLDINPSHSKCVEDKDADHLVDLYFWSLDYQKEIEIIINNSTGISNKLEKELNDKRSHQHIEVISQSMLSIFSLIIHAMQMPVMLLNDFDSFLRDFRKSEIGERTVAGWRKEYLLSQEQLLLQLKEIKRYRPWVDKCRLLHEGKIEKRELFIDITIPGIQHNKEIYKTNSWISIFSLMSILEEYEKKHESLNLDVPMKNAIEDYMAKHTATDADIDEIFTEEPKQVESLGTVGEGNHDDNLSFSDKQLKTAVEIMKKEKVIKNLYDYAYIMKIMNETEDLPTFNSPKSFLDYFKGLGITDLPGDDSIKKKVNATFGNHPSWTFTDTKGKDANEAKRRVYVGSRFLSIYRKGK